MGSTHSRVINSAPTVLLSHWYEQHWTRKHKVVPASILAPASSTYDIVVVAAKFVLKLIELTAHSLLGPFHACS